MKIRKKVLIIVAVLMIAVFLFLSFMANSVFLGSFTTLERQKTDESVGRTTNVLSNELAQISSTLSEWAFWDDTYVFVKILNGDYIRLNLADSTFVTLRLNLMLFINATGQIVYGEAFDLAKDSKTAMPVGIEEEIASNSMLWNHTTAESKVEGFLLLPGETLMFSSKPILTSQKGGPIVGAMIMGRYVDSVEIAYLSDTLGFPIAMSRFDDSQMQSDFQVARSSLSSASPVFVEPLNADSVGGYALLNDVFSNPAFMLRIDLPRDIYKQGLTTIGFFVVSVGGLCAVFGASLVILLEKGMLEPLSKLTKIVQEIGTREHYSGADSRFGGDEFSVLTNAVKDAISQRLAAIEELAGMVGHDLRNPLTGIASAAYYVRTKYGSQIGEKGLEMLRIIENDVAYSDKIVNDLLEYSGKIQLQYVDVAPKALVKDALVLVNVPEKVELVDQTGDASEITVDADKMKRVFVNLMKNAVDAMPQGGSLTIGCMKNDGVVEFTFSDTGNGMSKEVLDRIGTPLFTTKAKGMGFGLAISKRFVEAHGGSLSFRSTAGKGTTATILIPSGQKSIDIGN